MYFVYRTESFKKEMSELSEYDQERISTIFLQLRENPYVGDQLRIKSLREKRLNGKRVYYLVFDDLHTVLMVAISNKKTQQKTINYILQFIDDYRAYVKRLLDS